MENSERMSAVTTIKFTDELNELPLPYVNAVVVQSGVDDFSYSDFNQASYHFGFFDVKPYHLGK